MHVLGLFGKCRVRKKKCPREMQALGSVRPGPLGGLVREFELGA